MKRRLLMFVALWGVLLALMVAGKVLFMLIEPDYTATDLSQLGNVLWAGLSMDISMAVYLVAPVVLWSIASVWTTAKVLWCILDIWLWVVAAFWSAVTVTDAVLYPFWHFRLDATPLFYFTTSPAAALASVAWYWEVLALLVAVALAWGVHKLLRLVVSGVMPRLTGGRDMSRPYSVKRKIWDTVIWLIIGGLMVIPIRGGVTVSTMSPGRAYWTENMRLNHAAVNPMFSFVYSLSHVDRLGDQFKFFEPGQASAILSHEQGNFQADSTFKLALRTARPDVWIVILESFSTHLMPSLGGEAIAVNLDSIAAEGVLFTNFYAESFRTDRALPTILSGLPAMPTTSALRYPNKFASMPSIAKTLKANGYATAYFYGGDINFTNLRAYLVATGFSEIVRDTDFPVSRRLSKWGAHDEDVFARALAHQPSEASSHVNVGTRHVASGSPVLRVIQTSSSHEPFEVPYRSAHADARANAFAYADSCLGDFVRQLKASGRWENSLLVIVPDHWGSYPPALTDRRARHHIPLVIAGGALSGGGTRIATPASQSAIAPMLLAMMGLENKAIPPAWLTEPEWMGTVDADGTFTAVMADKQARPLEGSDPRRIDFIKAYTQTIYQHLDSL